MLSQALKGSSSSACTSIGLASSQLSQSTSLLESSSLSHSHSNSHSLSLNTTSGEDDSLDTSDYARPDPVEAHDEAEEEPFWNSQAEHGDQPSPFIGSQHSSIDALCRSFVASSLANSRSPLAHTNSSSIDVAGNNSSSSATFMMARSCPKPIVMLKRGRQGSMGVNQDELSVFVPPHELAASSLLDPTNVSESLCRKGSAAIRLRSGVLRRTGYLEGHTETLRPQTSITSFRQ